MNLAAWSRGPSLVLSWDLNPSLLPAPARANLCIDSATFRCQPCATGPRHRLGCDVHHLLCFASEQHRRGSVNSLVLQRRNWLLNIGADSVDQVPALDPHNSLHADLPAWCCLWSPSLLRPPACRP